MKDNIITPKQAQELFNYIEAVTLRTIHHNSPHTQDLLRLLLQLGANCNTDKPGECDTPIKQQAMRRYNVNIDMNWSKDYSIKAKSSKEANKKALDKFRKRLPINCLKIIVDRHEG